jgi:uncharacterized protein (TIGR04206 family)
VLLGLALVPWSVQLLDGTLPGLRFVWGMVSFEPLAASTLFAYLAFGGAPIVFDWTLAAGFFVLAVLATAAEALTNSRYGRVAAGLLALAGIVNLSVAWTFSIQPGRTALSIGTVLLWYVAWRWWRADGGLSPSSR